MGFFKKNNPAKKGRRRTFSKPYDDVRAGHVSVGVWLDEEQRSVDRYAFGLRRWLVVNGEEKFFRSLPLSNFPDAINALAKFADWCASDIDLPPSRRREMHAYRDLLLTIPKCVDKEIARVTQATSLQNGDGSFES